ncbi:amidase family protein, partial [Acetobacter oeni]
MTELSGRELLEKFRTRSLSPLEYARSLVAHISRWEPALGALYLYDPDKYLAAAKESEQRWFRGEPNGPLDGLPATVKELIATKGDPVPQGSAASPLIPAPADAPVAARL